MYLIIVGIGSMVADHLVYEGANCAIVASLTGAHLSSRPGQNEDDTAVQVCHQKGSRREKEARRKE